MKEIIKIKNKWIIGFFKNEPKYIVIDKNHIEYRKE